MRSNEDPVSPSPDAIESAFEAALNAESERSSFLDQLDARDPALGRAVRGLVEAAERTTGFAAPSSAHAQAGTRIGGFELVDLLGEGGFGVVWRARPVAGDMPDVALKLLRPGLDRGVVEQRFEREREVLGRLDHAHIARILDGGASESGAPFIAMELVRGVPITEFVREAELVERDAARLMTQVCRAVEHAHTNGVLHRDLKASNVLVTDESGAPLAKVIDFGVARLLDAPATAAGATMTAEGHFVGSPGTMSPEQAGRTGTNGQPLPIDEQTDVFALGRLLFELSTGEPAIDVTSGDRISQLRALERVRSMDAVSPRARAKVLRRPPPSHDLDAVVLTATALERSRRYDTVAALRAELERIANGAPVVARRPSFPERCTVFSKRHRVILVPAALIVAALTVALLSVARARDEAVTSRDRMERVVDAQAALFKELDVQRLALDLRDGLESRVTDEATLRAVRAMDAQAVARDVLNSAFLVHGRRMADRAFASDPEARARLYLTISDLQRKLGLFTDARDLAEEATTLRADALGPNHPDTLAARFASAATRRSLGDLDGAEAEYSAILESWLEIVPASDPRTFDARIGLAMVAYAREDLDGAAERLEALRDLAEATDGSPQRSVGFALNNLGSVYERLGRTGDALDAYEAGRTTIAAALGENADALASSDVNIGRVLAGLGRLDEAEEKLMDAAARIVAEHGDEHPDGVSANSTLAALAHARGQFGDAAAYTERALAASRRMRGSAHPESLRQHANLATILLDGGRASDALDAADDAIELALEHLPRPHVVVGGIFVERGRALGALERFEEGFAACEQGHAELVQAIGASNPRSMAALETMAALLDAWHEADPGGGHDAVAARLRAQ